MVPASKRRSLVAVLLTLWVLPVPGARLLRSSGARRERELGERQPIRRPVTDTREYLHTTFDSGLRVLAVHDPEAEKSSFAVAVEAGSLEDPPDFQGLAHFCEHMVFLGSDKYPDKDAFSKQLALYGGSHNAYTASEETVYFGELGDSGLDEALDIFAQFFISPSFKEEMVDKEIHAVDSEHKKNQPDTQRRLWHLLHSKADPGNPTHQFATGDLRTLKDEPLKQGKSLVKALRDFHTRNYCPGRLHLVLVANRSTEELLDLGHRHFDALPRVPTDACGPRPVYFASPAYTLRQHNLARRFTVGTHGSPQLWLMFPVQPLRPRYQSAAEAYIWHALAHYGHGSLKALLLKEDLSQSYSYYAETSVAGSAIFMTFALTEKGAKSPEQVLEYTFAYLNSLRAGGVDEKLLANLQQMRQVEFDYQERQASEVGFAASLAGALPKYAPLDVLTGGTLIDRPDKHLVEQVLAYLSPTNANVVLVDPTFNESRATHREPYYDFGYEEAPLDTALISRLGKASGYGLAPPPDLKYVPRKLELIAEESPSDEGPRQLEKKGRVELWWLGRGGLRVPKALIFIKLALPRSVTSRVQDTILVALHARVVKLVLEEPSDALLTCGLSYSVSATDDGLSISFAGFDEHLADLAQLVMPRLREPGNTEADFEKARRQLLLDLSDVTRLQPYQHALEAFEVVTSKDHFARAELSQAAQDVSKVNFNAYRQFLQHAFAEARLSLLFSGNIGSERAKQMTAEMEQAVGVRSDQPEVAGDGHQQILSPKEELEVRVANPIVGDPNSATLVVYQFGIPTLADRVHFSMLGEFIDRPVFEALRTERQLGYVVFGYVAPHGPTLEVRVLVQGFREAPDRVAELVELTVQNLTKAISNIGAEEFETRKRSLRRTLSQKPVTLAQLSGQYWGHIWDQTYCFQKQSLELRYLDSANFSSSQPLLDAWKRTTDPQSGRRKKISVKLFGSSASHQLALSGQKTPARKVITLVDSTNLGEELQDEQYWPHEYLCH